LHDHKHALNNKAAFSFYSFRAKLPLVVTYSAIAIVRTAKLVFLPITLLLAFTPAARLLTLFSQRLAAWHQGMENLNLYASVFS
jgi:hypothetical protein